MTSQTEVCCARDRSSGGQSCWRIERCVVPAAAADVQDADRPAREFGDGPAFDQVVTEPAPRAVGVVGVRRAHGVEAGHRSHPSSV
ncbi:hypothetical protein [Streptomyces glaucus]|uniref:hypothetical protein n=1 Tax=Streptomyces glaucus TaxID=284029 RepID=UPI0031D1ADB5